MTSGYYGQSENSHPHGGTPDHIIDDLTAEFGNLFDPCPNNPTFDGLKLNWCGVIESESNDYEAVFVNPPYTRGEISKWVAKGEEEASKGITVILLIPSYTDTKYFHKHIINSQYVQHIRWLKGRLKFKGYEKRASFPSVIVVYQMEVEE